MRLLTFTDGILVARHDHYDDQGFSLPQRGGQILAAVKGRKDSGEGLGHWEVDKATVGDLSGATYFKKATRKISGWAFGWAVQAANTVGQGKPVPTGGGSNNLPDPEVLPLTYDELVRLKPDSDFESNPYQISRFPTSPLQRMMPKLAKGTYGMLVASAYAPEEKDVFLHGDPRMVAANFSGDPAMSSMVYDLTPEGWFDPNRGARVHSMQRVVRPASITQTAFNVGVRLPDDPERQGQKLNVLAWNHWRGGRDDVMGFGAIFGPRSTVGSITPDSQGGGFRLGGGTGGGGTTVADPSGPQNLYAVGLFSDRVGGPLDVGHSDDMHSIGQTVDGEQINVGHLNLNSLFRGSPNGLAASGAANAETGRPFGGTASPRGDGITRADAQLYYEGANSEVYYEAPYLMPVHFVLDRGGAHNVRSVGTRPGVLRWLAEGYIYWPPKKAAPPGNPGTPTPGGSSSGGGGTGGGGSGSGGSGSGGSGGGGSGGGGSGSGGSGGGGSGGSGGHTPPDLPGKLPPDDPDPTPDLPVQEFKWPEVNPDALLPKIFPPAPMLPPEAFLGVNLAGVPAASARLPGADFDQFAAMTNQLALPAMLFRPTLPQTGLPDLRSHHGRVPDPLREFIDSSVPITMRVEGFGAFANGSFKYTQAPTAGRFRGGTASGGILLLNPELDIMDAESSFAPGYVSRSTSYMAAVPGVYWAAGYPDLPTGGIKTGYRWGTNSSGVLIWEALSAAAAASEKMRLDASGNLGIGGTPTQKLHVFGGLLMDAANKLYFRDTGTYIQEASGLIINSGSGRNIIINPDKNDTDVQIKADTEDYALHVDGTGNGFVGIRYGNAHSALLVNGSFATIVASTSIDLTLNDGHQFVKVDASVANRTITAPDATTCSGRIYTIKKVDGTGNRVRFQPSGGQTVDGAAQHDNTTALAVYSYISDGSNWWIYSCC